MSLQLASFGALRGLTVGHVTHDQYEGQVEVGGSAYYAARAWHGLGVDTTVATSIGPDFDPDTLPKDLKLCASEAPETTVFCNTYPEGEDRVMKVSTIANFVTPRTTNVSNGPFDMLFLAPVIGELDIAEWLDFTDARIVGIGLQGFLKQPGVSDVSGCALRRVRPRYFRPAPELLSRAHAVFLSEEDIADDGHAGLLDALRTHAKLVLLTKGEAGAVLFYAGGEQHIGVYPTVAEDPTGAGDVVATAFMYALASGCEPSEAARFGAAAASVVVEARGGACLHRIGEAQERFDQVPLL